MSIGIQSKINAALEKFSYPLFAGDSNKIVALKSPIVECSDPELIFDMAIKAQSQEGFLKNSLERYLSDEGIGGVAIELQSQVTASPGLVRHGQLSKVKNIIMVASGKGGVGKSTTAINLALALKNEGATVGVLDADIYGPSLATMIGIADGVKPEIVDEKLIKPIYKYGLKTMSVGYMAKDKAPMIWRGPMATKALQQFLELTLWGELDYLILDMPPGTGDIHISLAQKVNISAAVIVTTPQEMALADARKGIEMFHKSNIPILGIVENMATHVCSNCGHEEDVFGAGGADKLCDNYRLPLLSRFPLNVQIQQDIDMGAPTMVSSPNSALARTYIELANRVAVEMWRANLKAAPLPTLKIVE